MKLRNPMMISLMLSLFFLEGCLSPQKPFDYTQENPLNVISVTATQGYCQDIALMDSIAYVADGQSGIEIIRVIPPESPVFLGYIDDQDQNASIEKVRVIPELALLFAVPSSWRVDVYSLDNPARPENINLSLMDRYTIDLAVISSVQDTAFALFTADRDEGMAYLGEKYSCVQFFDTTICAWEKVEGFSGAMKVRGWPRGISISDSLIILASEQGGVDIFRIDSLFAEEVVHWRSFDTPGSARKALLVGDYIYVADGRGGLVTYSYPEDSVVSILDCDAYLRDIDCFGDRLLLSAGDDGILVASIEEPEKPVWIGKVEFSYVYMSTHDKQYIYIADRDEGLIIGEFR